MSRPAASVLRATLFGPFALAAPDVFGERTTVVNIIGLMQLWADFDPISRTVKHPDFMAFAERMGFVAAWDKYGWPDRLPWDPRLN